MRVRPIIALTFAVANCTAVTIHAANPTATAQVHYKWTDEQGAVHFSDTVPPDSVKFGYDVLNSEGIAIRHVDRARTPEEIKAMQAEARQREEAKRRAADLIKADQQLLAAYPTEGELIRAQKAQIEVIDQNIRGADINIKSQERSLADLLSRAGELERANKPLPAKLAQQIGDMRNDIEKQRAIIQQSQQEKTDSAHKFELELDHYRELVAKAKAQQR